MGSIGQCVSATRVQCSRATSSWHGTFCLGTLQDQAAGCCRLQTLCGRKKERGLKAAEGARSRTRALPAVYTKCPACTTPSIFTVSVTDEDDRNEHATVRTLRPYTYTAQHLAYTVRPILYSHGRLFDVALRLSTWCLALAPTARSAPCARCLLHAQRPSGHTTAISGHAWSIAPQGPPSPACAHLTRGRRGRRGRLAPGRRSASGSRVPARRSRQ